MHSYQWSPIIPRFADVHVPIGGSTRIENLPGCCAIFLGGMTSRSATVNVLAIALAAAKADGFR